MQVETWILAVLGIGVAFIGWIAVTVLQIKFAGIKFSTSIEGQIDSFSKKMDTAVTDIKQLFENFKLVERHDDVIKELSKHTKVNTKCVRGVERFLGDKHGSEFYAVYEKYQDIDS